MKKIIYACLPLVALMAASCAQKNSLDVKIKGWQNDTILINSVSRSGESKVDTVVAEKGHFTYDVAPGDTVQLQISRQMDVVESPSRGEYQLAASGINVMVLDGEKIAIKGKQEQGKVVYTSKGSVFEENRSTVNAQTIDLLAQVDRIQLQADSMINAQAERDIIMPLFEQQMQIVNQVKDVELTFIKANPEAEFSGFLLTSQPIDTTAAYYETLSETVRNGIFKSKLDYVMDQYEVKLKKEAAKVNIQVGKMAPNFTLTSLDGTPISLYDIKDKYIVIDFWGNWCGWCVKGFPEMKKCYAKLNKKVEIVGIDCGDTEAVWKASVAKHELPWIQVINGTGDNDMTITYAVEGFPTKIIISPEYIIEEVAMGETEDFYTKLDELVK